MAEHKWLSNQIQLLHATTINVTYLNPYISYQGNGSNLTSVAQGAGSGQRQGDAITCVSLHLIIRIIAPELTATFDQNFSRIIVFIWKDDTLPVIGDIILGIGGTLNMPDDPFNFDSRSRYKILENRKINFITAFNSNTVMSENCTCHYERKWNLSKFNRGKGHTITFQSGSATAATNHIYLLIYNNHPGAFNTAQAGTWDYVVTCRTGYIDM